MARCTPWPAGSSTRRRGTCWCSSSTLAGEAGRILSAMAGEPVATAQGERNMQLSVVVPVYGCASCLVALHERLVRAVEQVTDSYELVLVDDRSVDGGWEILQRIARGDERVRAFRLSRNFGQHAAITAGLAQARGQWAVVMDCDLQEATEEIPRLWAAAGEGLEVVRTRRRHHKLKRLRRRSTRCLQLL